MSTGRVAGSAAFDTTSHSRVDRIGGPSEGFAPQPGSSGAARAGRLARQHRVQFLWAGNLKPAGHVARWLHVRHGLPYGLIVYGLDLQRLAEQAKASGSSAGRARPHRFAAGTVAISTWTPNRFQDAGGQLGLADAAERVRMRPAGVDTADFRPAFPSRCCPRALRAGLRGPGCLPVARLVPHKGIDTALDVVQRLRREGLEVGYAVAGEGPARPPSTAWSKPPGSPQRVRFLGAVPDTDLPALYNTAMVYLGLSREGRLEAEGFGLSFLEAAACGLPVVAGQGGGTADAVAHGITGYLVDTTSVAAAAEAVRQLLLDPSTPEQWAGRGGRGWSGSSPGGGWCGSWKKPPGPSAPGRDRRAGR